MKQGPAPAGLADSHCNNECRQEKTCHWKPTHIFCEDPINFQSLREVVDNHQNSRGVVASNLILVRYRDDGYNFIFGKKYSIRQCPNPLTDVIIDEREVSSDKDITIMARDVFGYKIKNEVNIVKNNALQEICKQATDQAMGG